MTSTTISTNTQSNEAALETGPVVGYFLGHEIHAWVRVPEGVYVYDGIAPGPRPGMVDMTKLKSDEICISPGLCYKLDPSI
ncbi:hypothetical protein [Novimethylophilus kurashikiensis]|nr:hypothetical protein [Novimethylophilus kurashikiensis]